MELNLETIMSRMKVIPSSEPRCKLCRDSGWINTQDEEGRWFAQRCECKKAEDALARIEASGLANEIRVKRLDNFMTNTDLQKRMKATAEKYIQTLMSGTRAWLYIGGNPGSGKTHICTAVCGELLKRNISVRYMQWVSDSQRLKSYINDPDYEDQIAPFATCKVLYIDDLFKQAYSAMPTISSADLRLAFDLLNARYIRDLPTIITSEWDLLDQLLPTDEGIFSRVYEKCKGGYTVSIPRNKKSNYRLVSA